MKKNRSENKGIAWSPKGKAIPCFVFLFLFTTIAHADVTADEAQQLQEQILNKRQHRSLSLGVGAWAEKGMIAPGLRSQLTVPLVQKFPLQFTGSMGGYFNSSTKEKFICPLLLGLEYRLPFDKNWQMPVGVNGGMVVRDELAFLSMTHFGIERKIERGAFLQLGIEVGINSNVLLPELRLTSEI